MEKFNTTTEQDVGITQYLNQENKGFHCVLKHRYSDFIVNEINTKGEVVWIKTNSSEIQQIVLNEPKEEVMTEEKVDMILNDPSFISLVPNEMERESLNKLIINFIYKQNTISDSIEIRYIEDKNKRKQFHEAIRNNFSFLDSETIEDKDKKTKSLCVKYISNTSFYKRRKVFPDNNKKCLHFSMLKRNMDTVSAINYLAKMLHRSTKTIKFAGNKDKRGITTQRLSSYNTLADEVLSAMKNRTWNRNVEIGNFSFEDNELRLGLLKGNQFSVVLRFLEGHEGLDIDDIINKLKVNGFINYFGMQRFGVCSIPTHLIGKHVIKKMWKEAFMNIISTDNLYNALEQLGIKSKDISECIFNSPNEKAIIANILKIIPYYVTENKLLYKYSKSGKNSFQSSFKSLNRQLQVLYPHAYQSYIWNLTVSYRIKELGKKLIIGDIVKKPNATIEEINQEEDCDCSIDEEINKPLIALDNMDLPQKENENKDEPVLDAIFTNNYEYVTEDNIAQYSFSDLVIPIVGFEVYYPKNKVFNYIEDLLAKDGLTFKDFNHQQVNFNSTGYFRKVIEHPMNISHSIIHHDDPDEDLQTEYYNMQNHPEVKGTKYTSLRIQFQLAQSTYATMLFRELSKHSSAGNYQAKLSMNYNKDSFKDS